MYFLCDQAIFTPLCFVINVVMYLVQSLLWQSSSFMNIPQFVNPFFSLMFQIWDIVNTREVNILHQNKPYKISDFSLSYQTHICTGLWVALGEKS